MNPADHLSSPAVRVHDYAYDAAGNRAAHVVDGVARTARFNSLNQLSVGRHDGAVPVRGTLSEPAQLEASDGITSWPVPLSGDANNPSFNTEVELTEGTTTDLTLTATDPAGNSSTQTIRIAAESGQWITLQHDADGNVTLRTDYSQSGSPRHTYYSYDRLNRLTRVSRNVQTIDYQYNAFDERVGIKKQLRPLRRFLWVNGNHPAMELSDRGQAVASFFADGERRFASNGSTTDYLHTKDHLGSIRDVVRVGDGQVVARCDYSPFGQRTILSRQNFDTEWGFTGHFHNEDSGLILTKYRAYSPDLGRWLSPDPLGEGVNAIGNLYNYVGNDPINAWDLLGLEVDINLNPDSLSVDGEHSPIIEGFAENAPDNSAAITVLGHGTPSEISDQRVSKNGSRTISPESLADLIKSHPEFDKCKRVILYSCNTGRGRKGFTPYAKRLATLLGIEVAAPNRLILMAEDGSYIVADREHSRPLGFPDTPNTGSMQLHQP